MALSAAVWAYIGVILPTGACLIGKVTTRGATVAP